MKMDKQKKEILNTIIELIKKIDKNVVMNVNEDIFEPLTGEKISFSYLELLYLFLEIEDFYRIKFDARDVEEYRFNSINSISDRIINKLNL